MKLIDKNKGSCLIWGLVFILVIFILGRVAITQYHYAMDKRKAKKILVVLGQIEKAEKEYKAKTNKYTMNFENLNINYPPEVHAYKNHLVIPQDETMYSLENNAGVLNIGVFLQETERRYAQIIYISPKERKCIYDLGDKRQKKFCMEIGCHETKLYSTSCDF